MHDIRSFALLILYFVGSGVWSEGIDSETFVQPACKLFVFVNSQHFMYMSLACGGGVPLACWVDETYVGAPHNNSNTLSTCNSHALLTSQIWRIWVHACTFFVRNGRFAPLLCDEKSRSSKDGSGLPQVPQRSAEPLGFCRRVLRKGLQSRKPAEEPSA